VSEARAYVSPKRQAKAAATREAILEAFVEQVADANGGLSPSKAAIRAGVSVRSVHTYFPNRESQIVALGEWFDRKFYPDGVRLAEGADDLPRYFRDIHANALTTPLTRTLATATGGIWPEVRQTRRRARLDAIRRSVEGIGAPARATEDATAMLFGLSGADASWPLHDQYGLPVERIPDVIANTVRLIIKELKSQTVTDAARPTETLTRSDHLTSHPS
jgi:AcrR family transcriptional regulator